jgi:membrane dipeptidase
MRTRVVFPFLLSATALAAQDVGEASAEDALVARARAIHERVLTLDTHKDIPDQLAPESLPEDAETRERFRRQYDPTVRGEAQVDFPKMREGHYDCAFFIVYVDQGPLNDGGYKRAYAAAQRKFEAIERMARLHPEHIEIARSPDDVVRIAGKGKLVACIGIENGYPMGEDLGLIAEFHARGARYMSIAHNRHSQLGDSHTPSEPLHGGLTELGRKAIAEMNRLGIMVDVSHAAKSTMLQTLAASKAPVIASHSGCRALCDISRNLDDEQLLALRRNGGVVQCVALASFVKISAARDAALARLRAEVGLPRDFGAQTEPIPDFDSKLAAYRARVPEVDKEFPKANVADFVDHIDHAVDLIGLDHVAISSDFDGGGGVAGWNDASETFNVTLELVRRGYTEEQIGKIWSGNTLRIWREVEKVAAELQGKGK